MANNALTFWVPMTLWETIWLWGIQKHHICCRGFCVHHNQPTPWNIRREWKFYFSSKASPCPHWVRKGSIKEILKKLETNREREIHLIICYKTIKSDRRERGVQLNGSISYWSKKNWRTETFIFLNWTKKRYGSRERNGPILVDFLVKKPNQKPNFLRNLHWTEPNSLSNWIRTV